MRRSFQKAMEYLCEQNRNHCCPNCGHVGNFRQQEQETTEIHQDMPELGELPVTFDRIFCECGFSWQMSYEIVLSSRINLPENVDCSDEVCQCGFRRNDKNVMHTYCF